MDFLELAKSRRSIRSYKPTPVESDKVLYCLEAARWAPSSMNSQPWEFIVVTDPETRRRLAEVHRWGRHMAEAPVVIIALANMDRATGYWQQDMGAAIQNLLLAAHAQGLGTCWIGVSESPFEEKFKELLGVSDKYRVVAAITLGYPAESPSKTRRSLEEIAHWERFGKKNASL